ncbi:MAG TPA: thiamine phosphate synthase, partial [Dehalococcoidia bacterium]|nr:thiamine phosphate synthase [Dehalococcoidia bacterium]
MSPSRTERRYRLPSPALMLVTDRALCGEPEGLVAKVEAAVGGGVDAVQLRERDLPRDDLLLLARRLREAIRPDGRSSGRGRALLLVNGSLDVALACGADGLHLPEAAPPI